MSRSEAQQWALTYADLGWRVFPVVVGGKKPMYTGWQADATTDPAIIARYWRGDPSPNIGIVCGESFVAFDVEAAHLDALRAWMRSRGHRLPDTPIARTGRGGIHILARVPSIEGGRDLFVDGVHVGELKAMGGFIVACPSTTIGAYGWLRSPVDVEVAEAPEWLEGLARVRGPRVVRSVGAPVGVSAGQRRLAGLARTVEMAPEGRRNKLLYWAMRRALEDGLPAPIAASVLTRMARVAGLGEREVAATIASALEAATR